ncbi:MAG: hypothetical protein ACREDZ_02790 [Kiloniellales bacterium]
MVNPFKSFWIFASSLRHLFETTATPMDLGLRQGTRDAKRLRFRPNPPPRLTDRQAVDWLVGYYEGFWSE